MTISNEYLTNLNNTTCKIIEIELPSIEEIEQEITKEKHLKNEITTLKETIKIFKRLQFPIIQEQIKLEVKEKKLFNLKYNKSI